MYRNKKDVDKYVENLLTKLSAKEIKTRAFSIARLYFDVGDYASCQKYVEQYLTQKDNNAAAYKLLGQTLQKLGQKDKALDHYNTSLNIDPTQTSTILDICELLTDNDLTIEPAYVQHWCEKAEAMFPRHPITFRLREKHITLTDPDPEALVKLLKAELAARPKDASLHARLLKHYLNSNKNNEAFEYSYNLEFSMDNFINNYNWYEVLDEVLKHNANQNSNWHYQLLLLTVRERLCVLSLAETPSNSSKSLIESNELLHSYDQALQTVAAAGAPSGFAKFHSSLLQHHRGQFAFHSATFILKKAKKDQMSWRDANKVAAPLMLIAWQTKPLDSKDNWLNHAPEKLLCAVNHWYMDGSYRCSQSGHYLLSNYQDKNQSFLDQISQCCSGTHWKDKLYEKIFINRNHLAKIKSSHFVSNAFNTPMLRLPRRTEVEAYDDDALKQYGNSLHHFVWTLLNYKNYADFKCTLFDTLTPTVTNCGPETLNKFDIHAFLYCAALSAEQQKAIEVSYISSDKPNILPANITDLLCPLTQMKWWDCAYKFSQKTLGTELTDIRATLSRGIEVVRCIDNYSLDPELLCKLGRIFSEWAKSVTSVEEKSSLESRANLYYRSAIPVLDKLKSKLMTKVSDKRMFDYTHKELETRELNALLEESKLFVALNHLNNHDYEKAIETLSNVKSVQANCHLAQIYKKVAAEEINSTDGSKSKTAALLAKAKGHAYKALDMLKDTDTPKNSSVYNDTQEIIEDIEVQINRIEPDLSNTLNDGEAKYFSDENVSYRSEPMRANHIFPNISSTPKAPSSNSNMTNYRTANDSQILETTRIDQQHIGRIEHEIKNLQKRDTTICDFMAQTKDWFEENRNLGNKIISTMNSNLQNTTEQFKLLKISVDQVKDQIDECRNECKDVGELKKQIAELKKEVNKLKKSSSEQVVNENDLYNLDDEYRTNENPSNFAAAQLPFSPQMLSQLNQRPFPVPPNPYQLYNQSLYNLYSQYSQFAQPNSVAGAPPLFDAARAQMNYPGVYQTPDQMYLDVAHLIPPAMPAAPPVPVVSTIPTVPVVPTLPTMPAVPRVTLPSSTITSKTITFTESKDVSRSLPGNVVITSSDPLPTCTSTPAPVLSVTIPPKHIKGTPHNYQIAMPAATETKAVSPPAFSFSMPNNKTESTSTSSWKQAFQSFTPEESPLYKALHGNSSFDNSKTVVDGPFSGASPNTSLNKSRTLSEKSNTSIDNYDPCPDFKPIVPLPAEVKVMTGEEDEMAIFSSRAKLFRFVDKQWKERGIGEMKLLKHKVTGKVRVLMRREQVHKICANHIITSEMEIKPMKNETKAYFWVANDFAEETIVLEKFCIRFKTAAIANDFYDAFEKARVESISTAPDSALSQNKPRDKSGSDQFIQNEASSLVKESGLPTFSQNKTSVGGFTFSTTPVFKPVENDNKPKDLHTDSGNKPSVFSNLAFKSTATSPFNNLFTSVPPTTSSVVTTEKQNLDKSQLNKSDTVEEFEPNVEFKPVIPLPALVQQKTGEEDEDILFEHRAKLLRFDSNTKEWKERGLGNIKLLVHKDNNQKLRLLMRREQIMKVCCNHSVTKEMTFQKMPNMDKAVTWCAKDFSEGELVTETFCLRFKTVTICDNFMEAIKSAQAKLKDDSKAAKEEQNAAKQTNQSGFGDKFKAKPGSWECGFCLINNLENSTNCACCALPKPQTTKTDTTTNKTASWGDKFKPKQGTWECQACFVRNEPGVDKCSACCSPKDPAAAKKDPSAAKSSSINIAKDNTVKFSFGIPSQTAASILNQPKTNEKPSLFSDTGFGDKFKPKEGSWDCKQCLVRNTADAANCVACNGSKDPNTPSKAPSIFDTPASAVKFRFGIPPTPTNDEKPKSEPASIFDGTGAHKFNFGIPATTVYQKPTGVIFAAPKVPEPEAPSNFSIKKSEELTMPALVGKPALLPTPQTDSSSFASKESGGFGFVLKPTSSSKNTPKSPNKSQVDESDGEEYVKEEDCHAHFNPVIPMPDKVDVVTGEENETELYGHRARLYRFVSGEWKERGTGVVKILKHNDTNKLRVVMRREQVLKICLNHALTPEIIYKPQDEKSWLFAANDFSEGELKIQQLCLRFKNKEIALQFKEAADNALLGNNSADNEKSELVTETNNDNDDDVLFVSETQASAEDKEKAKSLMLPENFFTYKDKNPCQGCRGCKEDDDSKSGASTPAIKAILLAPSIKSSVSTTSSASSTPVKSIKAILLAPSIKSSVSTTSSASSTPVKSTFPTFQSPTTSMYGTPVSMEKTFDTSIFRTPLGTAGSNTKSSTPGSNNNDETGADTTNKENVFTQKPSFNFGGVFGNFGDQKSIFSTPTSSSQTLFAGGDSQPDTKSLIIAPPKLKTTVSDNKQSPDPKSIFASAMAGTKPEFGGVSGSAETSIFGSFSASTNKPVMFSSADKSKEDSSSEVKSLFGAIDQKTTNIFSGSVQGSIFGPNTLGNANQAKPAGSFTFGPPSTLQNSIFSSTFSNNDGKSFWGTAGNVEEKKPDMSILGNQNENKNQTPNEDNKSLFKTENTINFSSLNTEQKKPDGYQLGDKNDQAKNVTDNKSIFNVDDKLSFSVLRTDKKEQESSVSSANKNQLPEKNEKPLFKVDNSLSFAALSSATPVFAPATKPDFQWEGAGQQLFSGVQKTLAIGDKNESGIAATGEDEEYDPHYEPIVPLPEKIVVTTGEEDEEKVFGERSKLYRYDDKAREWKERGVGELKILYHPQRKSYRLLLRREQVHKAVLNMLLFMELELLPLKNSDRAWTWVGRNFAETPAGEQETLCVRFKSIDLANAFRDKVIECTRKLQVAAAQAIREVQEAASSGVAPLRLPKHLTNTARADDMLLAAAQSQSAVTTEPKPNGGTAPDPTYFTSADSKQVTFTQEPNEEYEEEDDEDYDQEDYDYQNYEAYYEGDEDENTCYSCTGEVVVKHGEAETCSQATIQVLFDQEIYSPKIIVTDSQTGEILADMLIHTDTEFKMEGDSCSWSGTDYTTNEPMDKFVTVNFYDSYTAMQFYESCQTSKGATYSSQDPES